MFSLNDERLQRTLTLSLASGQVNDSEKTLVGQDEDCPILRAVLGIVPFGGAIITIVELLSFQLNLSGLTLQMIGILVGGFGLVGEKLFDYSPLQALVSFLPRSLQVRDVNTIPFFRSLLLPP